MSRGGATEMTGNPMADFLRQHAAGTRQELAASDSETWRVADLLGLANESQRARWESLSLGYTSPDGNSLLRHRIAETYRGVRAREIIATQGAQEALSLIFEALLTPDDHAILILPTYPHTEHALTRRCAVTAVALEADRGWALDLDRVAASFGQGAEALHHNAEALARFEADGLVVRDGSRIRVTEAGRPFVRNVAAVFDAYLDTASTQPKHAQAV